MIRSFMGRWRRTQHPRGTAAGGLAMGCPMALRGSPACQCCKGCGAPRQRIFYTVCERAKTQQRVSVTFVHYSPPHITFAKKKVLRQDSLVKRLLRWDHTTVTVCEVFDDNFLPLIPPRIQMDVKQKGANICATAAQSKPLQTNTRFSIEYESV